MINLGHDTNNLKRLNDAGYYFYGENAVDKDQFKIEILVKTEQKKKKNYSCECMYASKLMNLLPTSLDAYTMQKKK